MASERWERRVLALLLPALSFSTVAPALLSVALGWLTEGCCCDKDQPRPAAAHVQDLDSCPCFDGVCAGSELPTSAPWPSAEQVPVFALAPPARVYVAISAPTCERAARPPSVHPPDPVDLLTSVVIIS